MSTVAAIAGCVILGALACLQLYVALGGAAGQYVWGGQHRVLPRQLRFSSAAAIILYAGFAAVLLSRAGVITAMDDSTTRVLGWLLTAYFVLATVLNALSQSREERSVMTPATALLALCSAIVAVS